MVFQDEDQVNWFRQLRRSFKRSKSELSSDDEIVDNDKWDHERGFELADIIEKGLARETVTDFMQPLARSSKLWRFRVERSKDALQYRLFSDSKQFLMYAQVSTRDRKVEFFLYNPTDWEKAHCNPSKPTFTMTWDKDHREWLLVLERCENCTFSPKRCACACHGRQQVAFIRHSRIRAGGCVFNAMQTTIPGLNPDGGRQVWCPLSGRGDLAEDDGSQALRLVAQVPDWNDDVRSLVLDFKGRNVLSSAKNFQLVPVYSQKPEHLVCQFAKIKSDVFGLDFRYPLNLIQAFATSLTTMFWD
mmetsp:Transcript_59167/g.183713  ORF Transcript_59167/g.183713 Transcript_59167/m.183713 type:complete len:302 (-) Transcript_59167:193-1098(-)